MSDAVLLRDRLRRYYTTYYRDVLGIPDWPALVDLREDLEDRVSQRVRNVLLRLHEAPEVVAGALELPVCTREEIPVLPSQEVEQHSCLDLHAIEQVGGDMYIRGRMENQKLL